MKPRSILIALILVFSLMLTATASAKPPTGENVFSAKSRVTPTINGIISPREWDDADYEQFVISYSKLGDPETHECSIYVKNDKRNIYFAITIETEDLDQNDLLSLEFDNNNDGLWNEGDNVLIIGFPSAAYGWGTFYRDDYYFMVSSTLVQTGPDTNGGGSNDGSGVFTHTWMTAGGGSYGEIGTYTFEISYPIDSADDLHDFSLRKHNTVGFKLRFRDEFDVDPNSNYMWPSPWPLWLKYGETAKIIIR